MDGGGGGRGASGPWWHGHTTIGKAPLHGCTSSSLLPAHATQKFRERAAITIHTHLCDREQSRPCRWLRRRGASAAAIVALAFCRLLQGKKRYGEVRPMERCPNIILLHQAVQESSNTFSPESIDNYEVLLHQILQLDYSSCFSDLPTLFQSGINKFDTSLMTVRT